MRYLLIAVSLCAMSCADVISPTGPSALAAATPVSHAVAVDVVLPPVPLDPSDPLVDIVLPPIPVDPPSDPLFDIVLMPIPVDPPSDPVLLRPAHVNSKKPWK